MTVVTKISIAVITLLAFSLAAVFALQIYQKNNRLQTELIEKQQQEKADKEYEMGIKEKKDIAAMMRGEMKMLTGVIEKIEKENKKIVIDIDHLGKQEEYTISISGKAKYFILEIDQSNNQSGSMSEENDISGSDFELIMSETDFDELEVGQNVEVQFAKRVDLESQPDLVAQKVMILKN